MLAGVNGTDPFYLPEVFLPELRRLGFAGVQNFPTVGLIDGVFRQNLEETGMGYGLEVEMIRHAASLDMLTTPYVFGEHDAVAMTEAGADIVVCHMGLTTGGAIGAETALTLDDCVERVTAWSAAARSVRDDVIVLCHGGPISMPDDAVVRAPPRRGHSRLLRRLEHGALADRVGPDSPDRSLQGDHVLTRSPCSPTRSTTSGVPMCFMCVDDVEWELLDWGSIGWVVRPANVPDTSMLCVLDVKLLPGKGHDFHTHPHQEEVILVRSGTVEQWVDKERKELTVGDVAVIPMGTVHATFVPETASRTGAPVRRSRAELRARGVRGGRRVERGTLGIDATALSRPGSTSDKERTMHMSMHNWMRSEPLDVTLARLARFGYESIEIKGEPDQYDTKTVRGQLDHYGLRCWGAVTLTLAERNLCAKDEAQRAASVQYVKDCVTMVKELDGEEITIVPSTVGKIVPDGTPEEEWAWAIESLTEVHDHASAAGIRMAIEPLNRFETHFVNRGAQALALADAVAPDVGICLDAFHMNIEEADFLGRDPRRWPEVCTTSTSPTTTGTPPAWDRSTGRRSSAHCNRSATTGALTSEFVAPIDRTPANPYPDAIETEPVDISPEEMQFIIDHGSSLLSESFYSMLVERTAQTILPLIS